MKNLVWTVFGERSLNCDWCLLNVLHLGCLISLPYGQLYIASLIFAFQTIWAYFSVRFCQLWFAAILSVLAQQRGAMSCRKVKASKK